MKYAFYVPIEMIGTQFAGFNPNKLIFSAVLIGSGITKYTLYVHTSPRLFTSDKVIHRELPTS